MDGVVFMKAMEALQKDHLAIIILGDSPDAHGVKFL